MEVMYVEVRNALVLFQFWSDNGLRKKNPNNRNALYKEYKTYIIAQILLSTNQITIGQILICSLNKTWELVIWQVLK